MAEDGTLAAVVGTGDERLLTRGTSGDDERLKMGGTSVDDCAENKDVGESSRGRMSFNKLLLSGRSRRVNIAPLRP
jgi:hypothetical protein